MYFTSGCGASSVHGLRTEGCTADLQFEATPGAQSFFGCQFTTTSNIVDGGNGTLHSYIGCFTASNIAGNGFHVGTQKFTANATGQPAMVVQGFPGDTTTATFSVQNSAGNHLFDISNQGRFLRVANSAPVTVTGSKAGNVALGSLVTTLANYGLIVDGTS